VAWFLLKDIQAFFGEQSKMTDTRHEDRTGQDRTGQDRTGQDRTGQDSLYYVLSAAIGFAFPSIVFAVDDQTQSETTRVEELDTVFVQGRRTDISSTVLPTRPPLSVYGTETTVLDTPRSVSQISAEQLAEDSIRSSDDLVKYAPGITRGGGQNAGIAPQFRGQGSEVFQDGQRRYSVRHPANFNAYEGADVVAGPSSVIFGSVTGSGGYINYLTKKPDFTQRRTLFSTQLGTWIPDGESRESTRFTLDHTGPINDNLAYRFSVTRQRDEDYYFNVENNFDAFYGAVAWQDDRLRIDFNVAYDDYFDWNITHGWNRPHQKLVDNGKYYAGRATPVIQNGTTLWSPVFASGAADSAVLGWVRRERNSEGKYPVVAGSFTTANPNRADSPGTVRGYVYDPTLGGNGLASISPQKSQRAEDKNTARRVTSQLRIAYDFSPNIKLVNSSLYLKSRDVTDATGTFQSQSKDSILDNRFEFHAKGEWNLGGVKFGDESNTGLIYRSEHNRSLSANNSFWMINAYDLNLDSSTKYPGHLLGLTGRNPAGGNGAWIGTPGVPQYSNTYGWLNLPAMYPAGGGLYAESVASYTSESKWITKTVFTQHNLRFGEHLGLNAGASRSWVDAEIENPFPLPGASKRKDRDNFRLYSVQFSPYVKPTDNSTVYFTYDRSLAINTGGFANGLSWGSGAYANRLDPLAFESKSELYELGVKIDVIPDRLFFSLSAFDQARDLSPDQWNNIARLRVKGLESTVRFQSEGGVSAGLNLTRLSAYNEWTSQVGFAPRGFVPDNATVFSDNLGAFVVNGVPLLNGDLPSGRFDVVTLPKYTLSGFVDYRHPSGIGVELSGWWTSSWYLNLSKTVKIPNEFNLDLALSYRPPVRDPKWNVILRVLNLTNELNFVGGLSMQTNTFLQPMPGRSVLAQFNYKF
jgi:outer membrane receptor for monomeric catechols